MIRGVDAKHVVIAGPTPYGTEFGVCEFLERYVGGRRLMPGPYGELKSTRLHSSHIPFSPMPSSACNTK